MGSAGIGPVSYTHLVADDKVVIVGFDALVDGTDKTFASALIKVEVSEKNDIIVTAQQRITVDTNVVVPVKLTVTNADGTNATVSVSYTHLDVYKRQICRMTGLPL